jgi:hypothetical protein
MRTFNMKPLAVAALVLAALYGAYHLFYPSVTYRYRLTLEAEVEGQRFTGQGVIEVHIAKIIQFLGATQNIAQWVVGEAVALDFGSRGILFVLLKNNNTARSDPAFIALHALGFRLLPQNLWELRSLSGNAELPLSDLPMMVRFRDINDPMTVEQVRPDNFEASFGPGARLIRATIEIVPADTWPLSLISTTGEPVTRGIEKRLGWLERIKGHYLDGASTGGNAPLGLLGTDFQRRP